MCIAAGIGPCEDGGGGGWGGAGGHVDSRRKEIGVGNTGFL